MRQPPSHVRHASRRVGVLVAVATAIFAAGLLQAGLLADLFRDRLELRVQLPEGGLSGLSEGANVEVLGTSAGEVTNIVLQPDAPFYAEVALDPQMQPFVRRDSTAVIRKEFGIAGNAYLAIQRGSGEPLDWDFAVIQARKDPAPAESVTALIADLRERVFPVIKDTERTIASLAKLSEALAKPDGDLRGALADLSTVTDEIAQGRGTLGRLVQDDTAVRAVERVLAGLDRNTQQLARVLDNLESGSADVETMTASLRDREDGLPAVLRRTNQSLTTLQGVLRGTADTMPAVQKTMSRTAGASDTLPSLLMRTESTLSELSGVLRQLRRSWLLGGGGTDAGQPARLSPVRERARP